MNSVKKLKLNIPEAVDSIPVRVNELLVNHILSNFNSRRQTSLFYHVAPTFLQPADDMSHDCELVRQILADQLRVSADGVDEVRGRRVIIILQFAPLLRSLDNIN